VKHDRLPQVREGSILTRKRFQFASALLIGAFLPWVLRSVLPGEMLDVPVENTLCANIAAVIIAFWMRLSVETYPGIRRSYVILPSALTGHGITIVWFLLTRFPYDRLGLLLGFLTPILAVIACLAAAANLLLASQSIETVYILRILLSASLFFLGPGAYSVDARLFGLRVTVVSPRKDKNSPTTS